MILIDTVYQKVLAIANKEQRGYITPQEFNLFANQAQMEIFEQYFYDINQFKRLPGNSTEYSDVVNILEEKISAFEKFKIATTGSSNNTTLPSDMYRLGTVFYTGETPDVVIEKVDKKSLQLIQNSPLTAPTSSRPIFIYESPTDAGVSKIKHFPSTITYYTSFTDTTCDTTNTNTTVACDASSNIKVGMTVSGTGIDTTQAVTVTAVNADPVTEFTISHAAVSSQTNTTLTFETFNVAVNYIKKPATVKWTYVVINDKAVHNSGATDLQNFELHESEESELVIKILQLAGISIKDYQLASVASNKEVSTISQEKQ